MPRDVRVSLKQSHKTHNGPILIPVFPTCYVLFALAFQAIPVPSRLNPGMTECGNSDTCSFSTSSHLYPAGFKLHHPQLPNGQVLLPAILSVCNNSSLMATRRKHTKSRTGCQDCKRRKVKVRGYMLLPLDNVLSFEISYNQNLTV